MLVKQTHSHSLHPFIKYTPRIYRPELCDGDHKKKVLYIGKQQAVPCTHRYARTHFPGLTGWKDSRPSSGKRQTEVEGTGGNMSLCGRWGYRKASWRSISTHTGRVGSQESVGVKIMKNFRVDRRTGEDSAPESHSLPRRSEVAGVLGHTT